MRIAFAANPALGHVLPLVPLATAAREAGHEIAVLGGASIAPVLAAHGLRHVEAGPPDLATMFRAIGAGELTGPRLAVAVWGRGFAEVIARPMAHALLALAETWRPDLLVHDDSEQGTWIAAERLGIPHVALQATAWRGAMMRLSAEPAGRLREELGLPPDPALATWHRFGFLATRPPGLLDPSDPLPASATPMRAVAVEDPGSSVAPWLEEPPAEGRRVAVTLGTVAPDRRAPLLAVILDALARLDAEIVVALGPGLDPAGFLPHRANIRLVSFVPMARLMPVSDLVVSHGGSGTMLAALEAGRPMVILPMAADQPANAAACLAAGAALVVEREAWTAPAIRAAVVGALADRTLAAGAERLRSEIQAMPPPEEVLPQLIALAGGGSPRG
jgi:UDP:flavonoid glycosyltransferase YjiC (YdhE family)